MEHVKAAGKATLADFRQQFSRRLFIRQTFNFTPMLEFDICQMLTAQEKKQFINETIGLYQIIPHGATVIEGGVQRSALYFISNAVVLPLEL